MFNKKTVWISGLSHIFNRWTPLKGGGDGLRWFLRVLLTVSPWNMCLCASRSPPQPWAASRSTVCWSEETWIESNALHAITVLTCTARNKKTCEKQTYSGTGKHTVKHSDRWHKHSEMYPHTEAHMKECKLLTAYTRKSWNTHSKSSINKRKDGSTSCCVLFMPSHIHNTHCMDHHHLQSCR